MAARQRAPVVLLPTLVRALRKETPSKYPMVLPSLRRTFSLYDQINLIDNVPEDQLRFQEYDDTGFKVNGVKYEAYLYSRSCGLYQILVFGCGRYIQPLSPELRSFIRSTGMKLEVLDSRNAASTYNILNEEGRMVAAALIPYGITS